MTALNSERLQRFQSEVSVNTPLLSPQPPRNFSGSTFTPPQAPGGTPSNAGNAKTEYRISELILHAGARVDHFEEKAAFAAVPDLYGFPTPAVPGTAAVHKSDVVDLTPGMSADGTLNWTPPPGRWAVLRIGYSLTGARNSPASPEATGLEVDKLNRAYVKAYLDDYLGPYKAILGPLMGKRGLQYMVTDSFEAGTQNWTDDMIGEFARRRGYDLRPWLPVLTGCVVESAESSDRFLWDFRKTIADLIAEYHYDQITDSLRQFGMGRYSESHETGRVFIADGMEVEAQRRCSDERLLGANGGAGDGPVRLQRRRSRICLRRPHLWTKPGCSGITDRQERCVGVFP